MPVEQWNDSHGERCLETLKLTYVSAREMIYILKQHTVSQYSNTYIAFRIDSEEYILS